MRHKMKNGDRIFGLNFRFKLFKISIYNTREVSLRTVYSISSSFINIQNLCDRLQKILIMYYLID